MNSHVYLVTNALNGKQYVGQTTVETSRVGHGIAIKNAYKKHGKSNFSYEIICNGIDNKNTLNYLERFWISVFNSKSPNGYNIDLGGSKAGKVSEETKKKLSAIRKGDKNPFFGKKHTEATKAKFKDRPVARHWLGKKFTESQKAHMTLEKKCPHCSKIGKGNAMVRWHMDNCKQKDINK